MAKKELVKIYLIAAALIALFLPGFSRFQQLKARNSALMDEIDRLKRENRSLAEERLRLETDVVYVERAARDKMGLVKKGEIVYKVPEEANKSGD